MVAQVQSSSNTNVEYAVTIISGQVVHCTCIGHFYGKTCRHMKSTQAEVNAEIARAARFLAVKLEVQGMIETWKCQRDMAWDNRF